jgi:predicted flap endonuclease-1-like 5' DNA nuclease
LQGLTLDAAVARLQAGRWNHQAHAASRQEVVAAGKETHGRVLRQTPDAATDADPRTVTVHFWVNLGSIPVSILDGIGPKLEADLSKLGIASVGELSLADGAELARALRINEQRARDFIGMANLVSRLAVLGLKEQVVELLVKGAGIQSLEQLAEATPAELHKVCTDAIGAGRVKVPRQFSFSQADVAAWIQSAKHNASPT